MYCVKFCTHLQLESDAWSILHTPAAPCIPPSHTKIPLGHSLISFYFRGSLQPPQLLPSSQVLCEPLYTRALHSSSNAGALCAIMLHSTPLHLLPMLRTLYATLFPSPSQTRVSVWSSFPPFPKTLGPPLCLSLPEFLYTHLIPLLPSSPKFTILFLSVMQDVTLKIILDGQS